MISYRFLAHGAFADAIPQKADDAHTLMQAWDKYHIFLGPVANNAREI